jgi:hypothetical protein
VAPGQVAGGENGRERYEPDAVVGRVGHNKHAACRNDDNSGRIEEASVCGRAVDECADAGAGGPWDDGDLGTGQEGEFMRGGVLNGDGRAGEVEATNAE